MQARVEIPAAPWLAQSIPSTASRSRRRSCHDPAMDRPRRCDTKSQEGSGHARWRLSCCSRRCDPRSVSEDLSLSRRALLVTAGCEAREKSQRSPVPFGGKTGEGKGGRANVSEPPMMPRDRSSREWEVSGESAGLAAGKPQVPVEDFLSAGRTPPPRGRGGAHPARFSCLGNVATPLRPRLRLWSGRPTVRKAGVLSGHRMAQQANAGRSKGNGKPTVDNRVSPRRGRITGRIRALVARPERVLTCAGWICE